MTDLVTKEQRLARFRQAGMIIGGCRRFDPEKLKKGEEVLLDEPGWLGRFAEIIDMDRGNLGKILSGQRPLSKASEQRLEAAISAWRHREVTFIRRAILLGAQIDAERQAEAEAEREAARLDAELDDDGPAPQIGG